MRVARLWPSKKSQNNNNNNNTERFTKRRQNLEILMVIFDNFKHVGFFISACKASIFLNEKNVILFLLQLCGGQETHPFRKYGGIFHIKS